MKERNGTSYSFGLRLWEIYSRRVIDAVNDHERLVTHYDFFFEDPESELRRIAQFIGLPDTKVATAAALVAKRRRHTHFTVDHLIDRACRPRSESIFYRALIEEASVGRRKKTAAATVLHPAKSEKADLLSGSVSRLMLVRPGKDGADRAALQSELLTQTETRHKAQVEELTGHLAQNRNATQGTSPRNSPATWRKPNRDTRHKLRNSSSTWLRQNHSIRRRSRSSPLTITGKSSNCASAL